MDTMNCFQCCYKHLAGALSYGKEIISGHDETNDLDHRIDFLGQLVNLEHHLQLINKQIFDTARAFRSDLQQRSIAVNEADLQAIRELYKSLEAFEKKIKVDVPKSIKQSYYDTKNYNQQAFTVVIDTPVNEEYFNTCYKLLKANVMNQLDIILINPAFDISSYEVRSAANLYDFIKTDSGVTENFIYMRENYFILKPFDFNFLENTYSQKPAECSDLLKEKGIKKFCYSWDAGKPQIINKAKFLEVMQGIETQDVLSFYFNSTGEEAKKNSVFSVISLDKALCCSNKARIGKSCFATALNNAGFKSLAQWIAKNLTI